MFKIIAINVASTVILIEIFSLALLKERIQRLFPEYLIENTNFFGRGYPRWHFSQNAKRGFDIAKNSIPVVKSIPEGAEPYLIFGNNIGCFDEVPVSDNRYQVYLAGDSFTWGYAPLRMKFGTLLEEMLQNPVAACGVSHTGQIHQFSKFNDITNHLGYYPKSVIVNVFKNDIANDFSHPHSLVIGGFQVDSVYIKKVGNSLNRTEIPTKELQERYIQASKLKSRFGRYEPRKYSATVVLATEGIVKPIIRLIQSIAPESSEESERLKIYDIEPRDTETYPIHSNVALRNRNAIVEWINHAKRHHYNLIFADLRTQPIKQDLPIGSQSIDQTFCDYIASNGSRCYSFIDFLSRHYPQQTWSSIIWKNNIHFNQLGNRLYAEFLFKSLQDSKR